MQLRSQVLKEIENKREQGKVGSSLEVKVFITCKKNELDFYSELRDVLREVFIVSALDLKEGDFSIRIEKADGEKCQRCWNWSDTVSQDSQYPGLCGRCVKALKEDN